MDKLYQIALSMLPGVGARTAKRLISKWGSPRTVFEISSKDLQQTPDVNNSTLIKINRNESLRRAEAELNFVEKNNIRLIFYTDPNYPKRLTYCEDAPALLYSKGNCELNTEKSIAIVGTRNATRYGTDLCDKLIRDLVDRGHRPLIVSGLAYGIDVAAHKAALNYNLDTVAVLGTGVHKIYPASHYSIGMKIIEQGCLLSEFPSDAKIVPGNFLSRNRIVAGMVEALIVVESSSKGGAMVTAEIANSYNRDVLSFPGRIGDLYSEGCNKLIKKNLAALMEGAEDLEYVLNWDRKTKSKVQQLSLFTDLSENDLKLIETLRGKDQESIDILSYETGISMPELSATLLNLEFAGLIVCLPGKNYALKKI